MKEILCVKCGQPAAFPTAVKEPYTCLTCQRSTEPSAPKPPATRAVCSKELLAVLVELADRIEAKKHSYSLAHSGMATHIFKTIADEIRAVANETRSTANDQAH